MSKAEAAGTTKVSTVPVKKEAVTVTVADQAKVRLMDEILARKNDNDPRLDREFNALSPGAKFLLQGRYLQYAPEKRNEKGTIVFLLGRNLTSESDFAFLRSVLVEPPCLSLEDCAHDTAGAASSEDLHHEAGTEVTLSYPQLVTLKSLEAFVANPGGKNPGLLASAYRDLEEARHSPIGRVADLADDILKRYPKRN